MESPSIDQENEEKETTIQIIQLNNTVSTELQTTSDLELISVCECLLSDTDLPVSKEPSISERKQFVLSSVPITEAYLREHRISELIRFLVAKIMCSNNTHLNVAAFVENLLNDCMMYRAGHGQAPVLFEEKHLQAIVKSFDPGDRGWLTAGQVRRAYTIIGLTPKSDLEIKTPTSVVLDLLRKAQELKLFHLLCAGSDIEYEFC